MTRPRHPKPEIEKAIQYAEELGWKAELSNGHAWGRLFCPQSTRDGCIVSIWSTPRSPENHARQLRKVVDRCPHGNDPNNIDGDELEEGNE